MAGLVFLADFFGWTAQEAAEAYIFRSDVQYALNLEPGVDRLLAHRRTLPETLSRRRSRRSDLPRRDHPAGRDARTRHLPPAARLDPRLQSHGQLRSHQADGRGDQAVLDPGQAARPRAYAALPEEFRRRYEPAESQLFAGAKDAEARQRSRQQAAEDLLWIIEHFADVCRPDGPLELQGPGHDLQPAVRAERRQGRREGQDRRGLHAEPVGPRRHLRRPQRPRLSGADSPRRAARRTRCS